MALVSSPPPMTSQTAIKIASTHLPVATPPFAARFSRSHRRPGLRCHCSSQDGKNLEHIRKEFGEQNLSDGLMDNYKNFPECLYGLTPEQLNMSMENDNIITNQAAQVTPESITSGGSYGRFLNASLEEIAKNNNSRVSMYRGLGGTGGRPPDLPSHLLDLRIVVITLPLYEAVAELVVAQIFYLDYVNSSKPIYVMINSTGTQDEKMEIIATETEGFAIVDAIACCKAKVYTINIGMAYGAAALILAMGDKGKRLLFPNSLTRLYLPKTYKINGPTTDMWLQVKDLQDNADDYLNMLSDRVGKSKEDIAKDIRHGRYFNAKEAIEYGLADRIVQSFTDASLFPDMVEKRARNMMLKAAMGEGSSSNGGPPSGLGLG